MIHHFNQNVTADAKMYHTCLYVKCTMIYDHICTQFRRSVSESRHGNMILNKFPPPTRVRSRPPQWLSLFHTSYRPGQHNWEFQLWKFHSLALFLPLWFYVKSILADFRWSKAVALTIMKALNFEFSMKNLTLESIENSQKFKIQSCSNGQNGSFWDFKMTSINLT